MQIPRPQPKQPRLQNGSNILDRFFFRLQKKIFNAWVSAHTVQEETFDNEKPVCYMLEQASDLEFMLLDKVCADLGLPRPQHPRIKNDAPAYFITLSFHSRHRTIKRHVKNEDVGQLLDIQRRFKQDNLSDALIVPVIICWDRIPRKEQSVRPADFLLRTKFISNLGRLMAILFNQRHISLQYSKPIPFKKIANEELDNEKAARKTHRLLRMHFRQQRRLIQGPSVSHRHTMIRRILDAPAVREAIEKAAAEQGKRPAPIKKKARTHALEIVSDMSSSTLHLFDYFLGWLWNKIYSGIKVHGVEQIKNAALGHEIVYVPCHRSYTDFLLLSYLLFYNNLAPPHIASGNNLNLPVVGSMLRRSGAFFMRRSFKDALYTAIFQEYLHLILTKGHSIEFFIEGGRSRTGRLLMPKRGMLTMISKSYMRDTSRSIAIVPVYFGYEKVMEENAYSRELGGTKKKKESLMSLIRASGRLNISYGDVHVNFAPPIKLASFLEEQVPDWQGNDNATAWLTPAMQKLGTLISQKINQATTVLTTNLVACCLPADGEQAVARHRLKRRLELLIHILSRVPVSQFMVLDNENTDEIIGKAESLNVLESQKKPKGDLLVYKKSALSCITWYKNNIIHTLILPAIVATLWRKIPASADQAAVYEYCRLIYSHIKNIYYLPWPEDKFQVVLNQCHDALEEVGILRVDENDNRYLTSVATKEDIEDYGQMLAYIASTVLDRYAVIDRALTQISASEATIANLTLHSQRLAERLVTLPDYHPELADQNLTRDYIRQLADSGEITLTSSGHIEPGSIAGGLTFMPDWLIDASIKKSWSFSAH